MKKLVLFSVLIMSFFFTVHAGFVIRGIPTFSYPASDLKNYTLTFTPTGVPVAAASMHTYIAPGLGKNTIVVVREDNNTARLFPLLLAYDPYAPNNVEVRDFHYDLGSNRYLLCGSRQLGAVTSAFVAVIDTTFSTMWFYEYPEADMFYSLCIPSTAINNYYLCGTKGSLGVIASVNRTTLQLNNFYTTTTAWEYHKIIAKYNDNQFLPFFIASGRTPDCYRIGFTTLDPTFTTMSSYMWEQRTEQPSHCVVSDNVLTNNAVILASSYQSRVTLNPVTFPVPPLATVGAYHFSLPDDSDIYYVQDIGTIQLEEGNMRISVAGIRRTSAQNRAWHGYVVGLSPGSMMRNNYYNGPPSDNYEHYKIRYHQGNEYTGGYCQNDSEQCALFGTPLTSTWCDNLFESFYTEVQSIFWNPFSLLSNFTSYTPYYTYQSTQDYLYAHHECLPFKGEAPAPEMVMPFEDESEIITHYDRITVKDIPENTRYQIYSITGQLLQIGATGTDISTAQLSKGIYILRLENGKVVKFVK